VGIQVEHINEEIAMFKNLLKGIALQFGSNCEVVLLDLSNFEEVGSVIVAIENGHITGRKVGDSGTNLGLELMRGGTDKGGDKYNYITQTKAGRILRSTTMHIRNSQGKPTGCLCINLDITDLKMAEKVIQGLTTQGESEEQVKEFFVNDVNEMIDVLMQEAQLQIGKPVAMMSKEEKLKVIQFLDQKGTFLIKKSSDRVCTYFNISKYMLYSCLDGIREEELRKGRSRSLEQFQ
jgi:predicted transcriptional regulator YheO